MKRLKATTALLFIALSSVFGAVSSIGAAPFDAPRVDPQSVPLKTVNHQKSATSSSELPHPVFFQDVKESGLLIKVWVNDTGPFTFAIDTGAGITLIADRVAETAHTNRLG